jgi:hypothetical protein
VLCVSAKRTRHYHKLRGHGLALCPCRSGAKPCVVSLPAWGFQRGTKVRTLGAFEHWDSDASRCYSRHLDRAHARGIDLLGVPIGGPLVSIPRILLSSSGAVVLHCSTLGVRLYDTADGTAPTDRATFYTGPLMKPVDSHPPYRYG